MKVEYTFSVKESPYIKNENTIVLLLFESRMQMFLESDKNITIIFFTSVFLPSSQGSFSFITLVILNSLTQYEYRTLKPQSINLMGFQV